MYEKAGECFNLIFKRDEKIWQDLKFLEEQFTLLSKVLYLVQEWYLSSSTNMMKAKSRFHDFDYEGKKRELFLAFDKAEDEYKSLIEAAEQ
jgi:hypothetical protein